jgi:ligand-binding sensor protein
MKDIHGNEIKEGCRIQAIVRGQTSNHILNCNHNFKIDLSEPVTVRKDERGVLMAGQISLSSYENRLIELVQ